MNKKFTILKLCPLLFLFLINCAAFAQVNIEGKVTESTTNEALAGVSIQVKGKVIGTITDNKGQFKLTTTTNPPFALIISSVGFQTQEIEVTGGISKLDIKLAEQVILGRELVVSASRVEESVMKSPVAIEKMDIRNIRETPSANFYDALANLKGIDMTTQGVLFKSVNMRGFGATGNPRTVQMIDGMDNQAPGLNFPLDNIIGMSELDVENVEVLPGAASALYGPNAINGLILMNSKSPFLYQGLSANVKSGVMHESNRSKATTPFIDGTIRYAKAFNNKIAFKVNLSYIKAKDWEATNYNNLNVGGASDPRRGAGTDLDYDGVNVYGDEVQTNINAVAGTLAANGLLPQSAVALVPSTFVSRTGYREKDLVDYNTKSFKANAAVHYRINEKIEAIAQVNYGYGTTVYTGTGRYSLRDFNLTQAKLEFRGDNFTVRAYTTQERSGKSYLAGLAAVSMLNDFKPHSTWFGQYVGAFATARAAGAQEDQAHLTARQFADKDMPMPGTAAYDQLLDKYRNTPIVNGGGGFADKTNLYHVEGFYNFKNEVKFVELLAGANYRLYELRSAGTLFADTKEGRNGKIPISEYGAFLQAGKTLLSDHLKLTASLRYDKNENFNGQFTPRISAVTTFGEHNIRLSYQTGFRIPTTQNQYIDLRTPSGTLIGGLTEFESRYNLSNGILRQNLSEAAITQAIANDPTIVQSATNYAKAAVTLQATTAITQAVTTQVTNAVNQGVASGTIPNTPGAIQAAITAGVNQALPGVLAAQLPGILAAQVPGLVPNLAKAYALEKLPKYKPVRLKPERIASYEIGYKSVIAKKLFIDAYYYISQYRNLIGGTVIVVPTAAAAPGLPIESGIGVGNFNGYSRTVNTTETITTTGFALGLAYALPKGFNLGGNVANNELNDFKPSAEVQYSQFNTPKYRYNLSFGRRITASNAFGFNVAYKYQQAFLWESSFVIPTTTDVPIFSNTHVPAVSVLDAQISYKVNSIKSIIKLGGTNLLGKSYIQAYGSPNVGSTYYVSITFDELLN
ncbi:carboxypeptidase-like regulatory domain-containing protein [Dyadobacter sp. CY326]|uniref:carboxypeptidase-like regulatory domain-containing protein n=1 Tax=Dyadobacter sp. CY326 TaxID=2907300 RepID=UPI001F170355|nr:carboxypeptidase-like regulatory domain-containing protein [Dyadobacter sp. CY326]MCE7068275.1 carboxypeptidase-like regulatory domain-containing protein [Dyadobacter sp. CY326]